MSGQQPRGQASEPPPSASVFAVRATASSRAGAGLSAAVVLMAYGSPERLDEVPAYYADIRGGRPIAPEHLDDLVGRYRRLGIEQSNPSERDHRTDARASRRGDRPARSSPA